MTPSYAFEKKKTEKEERFAARMPPFIIYAFVFTTKQPFPHPPRGTPRQLWMYLIRADLDLVCRGFPVDSFCRS